MQANEDTAMIIYTIGHSDILTEDFIKLLNSAGVTTLVDVRTSPYSRYAPQFNRENLIRSLLNTPIAYLYMGGQLGGYPKDAPVYRGKHPDYDILRKQSFYVDGLDNLLGIATSTTPAIMCSEEDPYTCHRRNLIGFDLHERGITVCHIRHDNTTHEDDYKDMNKIQLSLF
ncbi:MAG: DUF488 domain-containing protein [Candidatus Magnetominusculus sp. LBB02]|nr:DUF488 domain-containing protein [Candidatus Magnetominusculus sp. LBB02]